MGNKKKKTLHNDKFLSSKFYRNFIPTKTRLMTAQDYQIIRDSIEIDYSRNNTVSSFSSWVLESFVKPNNNLQDGKKLEKFLSGDDSIKFDRYKDPKDENFRRTNYKFLDNDWELEFEDISSHKKKNFKISNLRLNGKELYGRPDVVYRNNKTNDRIIVEIKNPNNFTIIPEGGWYNLQCQLWCYSMIDDFKESPNIFLYGDIRKTKTLPNWNGTKIIISEPSELNPSWRIRKNNKLNLENQNVENLHNQCVDLFQFFGGEIITHPI